MYTDSTKRISRVTLRPPDVDPPHPPMIIRRSNRKREKAGQLSKSADTKPVVDATDPLVKKASIRLFLRKEYRTSSDLER